MHSVPAHKQTNPDKLPGQIVIIDPQPDFTVANHGSIFLLNPLTAEATAWVEENIPGDAQYFGNAVAVEHRYIDDIVVGIRADGLTVQ
jgi:hypothetical protein